MAESETKRMKLVVLGGGPAGITAALQGRELGADVALIESNRVGGTSINYGPAPVRTLARAARLMRDVKSWKTFGLHGDPPEIYVPELLKNAKRVALYAHEKKHLIEYLRTTGIDVYEGTGPARFLNPHTVGVSDGHSWQADKIIVAVGGHSRMLPIPGSDFALTYENIWDLEKLPEIVAVVGAAATGCQLASILQDYGSKVILFELSPNIIPQEDNSISNALKDAFIKRGMRVKTGARTTGLERVSGGIRLNYNENEKSDSVTVDAVFFATGWIGNIGLLNFEAANLRTERGYIPVNKTLRTNVRHIFAVGDVNGMSMLVQSARYEGWVAAQNAVLDTNRKFYHTVVPSGSFTDPEYASVGLTEAQARDDHDCAISIVDYHDLMRPIIDNHPEGFCKLIVDRKTRRILGAHVIGEYSVEIIQMVAACIEGKMKIEQVAELQLAYPTFTEAVGMAAQKIVRELKIVPFPKMWVGSE
jgi:pyruvate/2-oxoglutarate dehydrogenase complex dihydrolipoamide dehydrogenase (E3) component